VPQSDDSIHSGLSATIGSPEIFNDWLAKVQEAHGFKHTFVGHPHRYSHLRKFFYVIKDDEEEREFISLAQHKATDRTRFIHPISALSFGRATIPDDLALEAKDTLTLYRAFMAVALKRGLSLDALERLNPPTFFSGNRILLRQRDVLEYEAELKKVISGLLGGSGPFQGITQSDAATVGLEVVAELQDPVLKGTSSSLDVTPNMRTFKRNLIHLLADLHVRNELVRGLPLLSVPVVSPFPLSPPFCSTTIALGVSSLETQLENTSRRPKIGTRPPTRRGGASSTNGRSGNPARKNEQLASTNRRNGKAVKLTRAMRRITAQLLGLGNNHSTRTKPYPSSRSPTTSRHTRCRSSRRISRTLHAVGTSRLGPSPCCGEGLGCITLV
jgi:hypothetical protein